MFHKGRSDAGGSVALGRFSLGHLILHQHLKDLPPDTKYYCTTEAKTVFDNWSIYH